MKKKIAITGHTSGIGLALYTDLAQHYEVVGLSRTNGYDLSTEEGFHKILLQIAEVDVFINNAYSYWKQTDLLYALFDSWKSEPKVIINISSNSGDGTKNYKHPYAVHKAALDKACEQLNAIPDAQCRVVNIKPAWVKTPRTEQIKTSEPMLAPNDISKVVCWILQMPQHMHVPSISLVAK